VSLRGAVLFERGEPASRRDSPSPVCRASLAGADMTVRPIALAWPDRLTEAYAEPITGVSHGE